MRESEQREDRKLRAEGGEKARESTKKENEDEEEKMKM